MSTYRTYIETPISVKPEERDFYVRVSPSGSKIFCFWTGTEWNDITIEKNYPVWLRPNPDSEAQAEWEFVKIITENHEAAKRAKEKDFAGTTKKEAVLEIYEDFVRIIKNLPLKRAGSIEPYLKSIDALADSDVERLREALEKIVAQEENQGREGCTYGDTDYDSMSVVYGYNTCLMYLKEIANKALSPTKTQQ